LCDPSYVFGSIFPEIRTFLAGVPAFFSGILEIVGEQPKGLEKKAPLLESEPKSDGPHLLFAALVDLLVLPGRISLVANQYFGGNGSKNPYPGLHQRLCGMGATGSGPGSLRESATVAATRSLEEAAAEEEVGGEPAAFEPATAEGDALGGKAAAAEEAVATAEGGQSATGAPAEGRRTENAGEEAESGLFCPSREKYFIPLF
jgi:hypothetical protein